MCLAIPGKIIELLDDNLAMIDVSGVRRKVNISLIKHENVNVNDWVLIPMSETYSTNNLQLVGNHLAVYF